MKWLHQGGIWELLGEKKGDPRLQGGFRGAGGNEFVEDGRERKRKGLFGLTVKGVKVSRVKIKHWEEREKKTARREKKNISIKNRDFHIQSKKRE